MSRRRFQLNRRNVLRGFGGFCVGLPFLELLRGEPAQAQEAPKRYMIAFAGSSLGMDSRDMVVPENEGALDPQNLTRGLLPLGDLGITDACSIVSNLQIPWNPDGQRGPGERAIQWHSSSLSPLLSGMRSADGGSEAVQGPTSDWMVAEQIGGPTLATRPVLTYRVQAAFYRGTNGTGGTRGQMSARLNDGNLERITPQFSPKLAFQDLFTGFTPPDPAEAAEAQFLLSRRRSVIDLVKGDTERLLPRLGAADKIRLERHFDELRALENKLNATNVPGGSNCEMLPDPGEDPPIGGAIDNGDTGGYANNGAWSNEELRAEIMVDLIHMAFACDLSRSASLMFSYAQCFLNMNPVYGYPSDLHELGHYSVGGGDTGANAVADGIAWHVKHFGRLAQKLRDTEELDGSNLLDHTAMVLLFEGGWGFDPEQNNQGSAHSSENMAVLVAGKAGGLNQSGGKHIRTNQAHPVQCINTAMQAVGVNQELGEVTGGVSELIG